MSKDCYKIAITCGGSGGHFLPGLVVAESLIEKGHEVSLIVTSKKIDSFLKKQVSLAIYEFPFLETPRGISLKWIHFLWRFHRNHRKSQDFLIKHQIDGVLSMGGVNCLPMFLSAKRLRKINWFHDSNVLPGKANRKMAKLGAKAFLSYQVSRDYLPKEICSEIVGVPIRTDFKDNNLSKEKLAEKFDLDIKSPILFILAGSQGSQNINRLILECFASETYYQIIHLTGESNREEVANRVKGKPNYKVYGFLEFTQWAYQLADLVICRSGGSTLNELAALGKAACLIPYPNSSEQHQQLNAQLFVDIGAAVCFEEKQLEVDQFKTEIIKLVKSPEKLEKMGKQAVTLSHRNPTKLMVERMEFDLNKRIN